MFGWGQPKLQKTDAKIMVPDFVISKIRYHLGSVPAEQGGALIGDSSGRIIRDFLYDFTARTTSSQYELSEGMNANINVHEKSGGVFVGICHSHPRGFNRLSGQDIDSAKLYLKLNPSLNLIHMPLVTYGNNGLSLGDNRSLKYFLLTQDHQLFQCNAEIIYTLRS